MPSPTTVQTVRQQLEQRAHQLEQEVTAVQARDEDAMTGVSDRKDEANNRSLVEIGSAEVERDISELREIAHALQRIDDGSYGLCADCGVKIDERRLLAQPTAIRCTHCQAEAEHRSPKS
ncbi:MAG: TraR/DksA family transcriptional regulator [Burkholderiales bacterium]|nr:TraR/DksA family transcriptional regulator [Burkholderiales bacterium]